MKDQSLPRSANHKFTYDNPTKLEELPEFTHVRMAKALHNGVDKLLGDTLTITDTLGLPAEQDKALKRLLKNAFYHRYRITAEELITVVFGVQEIAAPSNSDKKYYTCYQPNQNESITGFPLESEEE